MSYANESSAPQGARGRSRARSLVLAAAGVLLTLSCATTEAVLGEQRDAGPTIEPRTVDDPDGAAPDTGATGSCVATTCPEGLTTCVSESGPTYKCAVDLAKDPEHCGACGNECLKYEPIHMTSRCIAGKCELECYSPPRPVVHGGVPTDYRNCNGLLDDGCEVDLLANAQNCGACGQACAPGERCFDGRCGCQPGLTDCNGQCVDLTGNDFNCGQCGKACEYPATPCDPLPTNTEYGCVGGQCEKLRCFGYAQDCNGDLALGCGSDGCEVADIRFDPQNCGRCGNACTGAEECRDEGNGPECVVPCAQTGRTACIDGCFDLLTDPDHCGGCFLLCPSAGPAQVRSCNKGVCALECAPGFADCNGLRADGCETDLRSHPAHCGACGATCDLERGQPCVEGKCLVGPCEGTPR